MKRFFAAAMGVLMTLSGITVCAEKAKSVETEVIYVAPSGNDINSGTKDNPLKTLEAAKDAARKINDGTADIEVVLSDGEYIIGQTLRFDTSDGGKNGRKVTWKSDGNAIIRRGKTAPVC